MPLNTVFGVIAAIVLVRQRFRGRALLNALIDLPFAVSPVVVGPVRCCSSTEPRRLVRRWLAEHGIQVIFSMPGHGPRHDVRLPAVRGARGDAGAAGDRHRAGAGRRHAGRVGPWQTFWRITLPAIRWGVAYGVVLTTARALGEFGAVSVVSGKLQGQTETATLLVESEFRRFNETGAYAASVVLRVLALVTLLAMNLIKPKEART